MGKVPDLAIGPNYSFTDVANGALRLTNPDGGIANLGVLPGDTADLFSCGLDDLAHCQNRGEEKEVE